MSGWRGASSYALALLVAACGDVTADLVTDPRSGDAASPEDPPTGGSGGTSALGGGAGGVVAAGGNSGSTGGSRPTPPVASADAGLECVTNADCPACTDGECQSAGRDLCDTTRGRCVECVNDGHCDSLFEQCSTALGECATPCTGSGTCDADEICDTVIGFCVECTVDADCDPGQVCRRSECTM